MGVVKQYAYKAYKKISFLVNDLMFALFGKKDEILKYKDIYHGKECFVIGNGPSLRSEDLDFIKDNNYISFAANSIYRMYDKTEWRPTYVSVADEAIINDMDVINSLNKNEQQIFFTRSQFFFRATQMKCKTIVLKTRYSRKYLDTPCFSVTINKEIFDIASVTYFSLQLAAYMGFKTIYLIGMDNKYMYTQERDGRIVKNEKIEDHCYDDKSVSNLKHQAVPVWELDVAYTQALKASEEIGIRILNATRGGYLDTFDRINLDEIMERNRMNDENSGINTN